jgi:hypothetical protein
MLAARRSSPTTTIRQQARRSEQAVRNRESGVLICVPRPKFVNIGRRCVGLSECAHGESVYFGCLRVLWSFHGYCRH